jgi:hypothetical protein
MHIASFAAASGVSDSKGNTWIPKTLRSSVGRPQFTVVYLRQNPRRSAPAQTFTVSGTGIYAVIEVLAYDNDVAFDAESGAGSNGAVATIQPGSITPAGNNGLFITGVCANLGSIPSIDSGFTLRLSTANGIGNNMEAGAPTSSRRPAGPRTRPGLWDSNNIGAPTSAPARCWCSSRPHRRRRPAGVNGSRANGTGA